MINDMYMLVRHEYSSNLFIMHLQKHEEERLLRQVIPEEESLLRQVIPKEEPKIGQTRGKGSWAN